MQQLWFKFHFVLKSVVVSKVVVLIVIKISSNWIISIFPSCYFFFHNVINHMMFHRYEKGECMLKGETWDINFIFLWTIFEKEIFFSEAFKRNFLNKDLVWKQSTHSKPILINRFINVNVSRTKSERKVVTCQSCCAECEKCIEMPKKKKGKKKERESFENGPRQIVAIFNAPSRIPFARERMSRNRSRHSINFSI